jgi:uncharacterized protein YjiS (DUF1127 family)
MIRSTNLTVISTTPGVLSAPRNLFGRAVAQVRVWIDRSRQRHALGELDDRLLRDIAITRAQARREAARSYWDY